MSKKIRKGDQVLVLAGNDKGKKGEVLSRSEDRVVVSGVNVRKKHMKPTQQSQVQGGRIIEKEMSIDISNVQLCSKDGVNSKVSTRVSDKGLKELVFNKSGQVHRPLKKPA
jgi:large subunit ribosomal protein L24